MKANSCTMLDLQQAFTIGTVFVKKIYAGNFLEAFSVSEIVYLLFQVHSLCPTSRCLQKHSVHRLSKELIIVSTSISIALLATGHLRRSREGDEAGSQSRAQPESLPGQKMGLVMRSGACRQVICCCPALLTQTNRHLIAVA